VRKGGGFSFRNKLIVSFVLVSLLPVLAVQMISYYVSTDAMNNKIDDLVGTNLLQTSKTLDVSMRAYEDLLFQIITNDDVMNLVKSINEPNKDVELDKRKLINMLSNYSYAKTGIRSVAIFTQNGTLICYDQQTGSPYDNLWSAIPELTALPVYRSAVAHRSGSVMTVPEKIGSTRNKDEYGFHLARILTDLNGLNLDAMGVVVVSVYESVLADAINLNDPGHPQTKSFDNRNYLTDGDGVIVSAPDKISIGKPLNEVVAATSIRNSYLNEATGLTIHNLIDQNALFGEMYAMQRISILVGIAALILAAVLIYYFSGRLTSSIRKVISAMRIASQGGMNVQVEDVSRDEISIIAMNFNKMMTTVNELMTEIKESGEKRKEAEIRALEAQINPHFLYNTLDSINWLAIEKDEHQISRMLKGLGQILRYSIKDSNKPVTVREELEWMDRYVFLQQHRFRSSFVCEAERDEAALDCLIPKLIVQPFIENAIVHGFSKVKQGGRLRIEIRKKPAGRLEIRIQDNGAGMDEETRRRLLSGESLDAAGSGIGVRNVLDRIEAYYGQAATCEIDSERGAGTKVRLILPAIPEEESDRL